MINGPETVSIETLIVYVTLIILIVVELSRILRDIDIGTRLENDNGISFWKIRFLYIHLFNFGLLAFGSLILSLRSDRVFLIEMFTGDLESILGFSLFTTWFLLPFIEIDWNGLEKNFNISKVPRSLGFYIIIYLIFYIDLIISSSLIKIFSGNKLLFTIFSGLILLILLVFSTGELFRLLKIDLNLIEEAYIKINKRNLVIYIIIIFSVGSFIGVLLV